MLLGCEVLTKNGPPTHSFGKLSHPLNAALLYLCIKKCTNCKKKSQAVAVGGEGNFKWIFEMHGKKKKMQIRCVSISRVEENRLNFRADFQELISVLQVVIMLSYRMV